MGADRIKDNGIGMISDMSNKIYPRFFTTKPIGYGTGLGLAISHQIVKTHQGYLYCTSKDSVLNVPSQPLVNNYSKTQT
ncbi:hypothetical protein PL8927_760228 [Planktothrix serta PCC 8927]|uniref:histidine kinase n=1 Tax=Planktothrix serta PCC 8927 TaxID=671068 RepID=A0A7Z9BUJ5_9CYAN|nr:HAMP domain-containing sensor histidine kinase [Planktothrix serta]VXD23001.1 hypothetical protein PL8927_760228 [Planktothrix serta PCC 8927]